VKPDASLQLDVQGLRGIAVLLVVLYHAGLPMLPGGYVGVDVFFVISGYIITRLLVRERERSGTIDLAEFYARRARRLLPAAIVVIVATLALGLLLYSPQEQLQAAQSALAASLYASNLWFAHRSTDYLGGKADSDPLLHTWSLAVEEQYYLVWPGLVLLALRGASVSALRWRMVLLVAGVALASFLVCRHFTWKSQTWAFFGTHARAWEFCLGSAVFLLTRHGPALPRPLAQLLGMAGTLMVLAAAIGFDKRTAFPGSAALLPTVGAALVLLSGRGEPGSWAARALSTRPLVEVGNVSYSLYLWHWPALVYARLVFGEDSSVAVALGLTAATALAVLSYRLVENPVRHAGGLTRRVRVSLVGAALASVATAGVAAAARWTAEVAATSPTQARFAAARLDRPLVYRTECHAKFNAVDAPDCIFGHADAGRRVVLFGDSHAAHWFPAFDELAQRHGWQLVSLTKSACPSVVVTVFNGVKNRDYIECDQWREAMIGRIVAVRPELVVISNSTAYVDPASGQPDGAVRLEAWVVGLERLTARLVAAGIRVLVLHDVPNPGFHVPLCLERAAARSLQAGTVACSFRPAGSDAVRQQVMTTEQALASRLAGAFHANLNDALCTSSQCLVDHEGTVRYSDAEHLTATFSRQLAGRLSSAIRQEAERRQDPRLAGLFASDAR
jgi:peptidoglycan/LPS O-acetylase OafA/YrhL